MKMKLGINGKGIWAVCNVSVPRSSIKGGSQVADEADMKFYQ